MKKIQNHIKGVVTEMKKVTWPNSEELKGATIAVITFSIITGFFVFGVDSLLIYFKSFSGL